MDRDKRKSSSLSAYLFVSVNLSLLLVFLTMSSNSLRTVDQTRRLYEELFHDWYVLRVAMVDPSYAGERDEFARFDARLDEILSSESLRASSLLSDELRNVAEDLRDGWRLAQFTVVERLRDPAYPFHAAERRIVTNIEVSLIELRDQVDLIVRGQQRALEMLLYVLGATVLATIAIFWMVERESARERSAADRVQSLARGTIGTQEAERKRIASALHDSLAQEISLCLLQLGDGSHGLSRELTIEIRERLVRAIDWLRNLAYELRPAEIDQVGLAEAIRGYCSGLAERTGARIDCSVERIDAVPGHLAINVYRVGQEAIANAIRHAGDARIRLDLREVDGTIRLRVEDDGTGFDERERRGGARNGGLGMIGMRERALILSGSLTVRSAPGRGTRVELCVPRTNGTAVGRERG
ncbi:MAG: sensor histidine kinase [Spirochaetaceae bacterium]|nr:MAG: sensor histidine kinase [Spirochaetaceae bacterium]